MFINKDSFFKIYFGDAQDKIFKQYFIDLVASENFINKNICDMQEFENLKKFIKFDNLVFLNQVHGVDGFVFASGKQLSEQLNCGKLNEIANFKTDGDFLITDIKNLAIGVLTADCLPIVFVDTVNNIVAVAHAGWRGSVGGIAVKTLESMKNNFGTKLSDVKIFFGPCIKSCCYKVGENFAENLRGFDFAGMVLQRKPDGLYFNLPEYNILLLQEFGVKRENISIEYNLCTCCNSKFFSYRRGDKDGRQMTVVCL